MITVALAPLALGGEWSEQEIDPKARPTGTAYTIGRYDWKLGLVEQDFGLFENAQVGTVAALWALGVANGHAKVDAIRTKSLDIAVDGGVYAASLEGLGVPNGRITVTPVGLLASGVVSKRLGVHGGVAWTIARADGRLTATDLADGIASVTGADVTKELKDVLGKDGGVYAGANLTLYQTRFSADWRFNRRDSLVLTSNTYVWLSGLVAAGVAADDVGSAEVEVGASARVKVPLTESVPTLTTLSWQFSWRRTHLRVGVPLPLTNTFAYLQAFDLYWILGR